MTDFHVINFNFLTVSGELIKKKIKLQFLCPKTAFPNQGYISTQQGALGNTVGMLMIVYIKRFGSESILDSF